MRIAYVLNSLGVGGSERLVTALADRMAAHGHVVIIVVLRPQSFSPLSTRERVVYLGMRKTPWSFARSALDALRCLRCFRADIVHSHNFQGNILTRMLAPFLPGAKVLSTIHNVYEGGHVRMLAYRLTNRLSNVTAAVSRAAAQRYGRLKAVPLHSCIVITNGIDVEEFSPCAERREKTRATMQAGDRFVWIATARLTAAKDYSTLLNAVARLQISSANIQLWIAGEGDQRTTQALRALSDQLGLTETVHWLKVRSDVAALLDAADGFVLSSLWEGMPLALGEAMAMGKSIVATNVGGVAEMLGDVATLVEPGDAAQLCEAMLATMQSPEGIRCTLGHAARTRIVAEFNINAKVEEWESLYRAVLKDKKLPDAEFRLQEPTILYQTSKAGANKPRPEEEVSCSKREDRLQEDASCRRTGR